MRNIFNFIIVMIFISGISLNIYSQDNKIIQVRDFFRNPEKTYFQISPDGKYISFLQPYEKRMNIFIQQTGSDEVKRVTSFTDRDLSAYFWKNDDLLYYFKDFGGDENYHLFVVDLKNNKTQDLTPFDSVRVELTDELWDSDTDVLISMNKNKREVFDVYRLNLATGELKMAAENPGNITGWVPDHNGRIRAAISTDGVNSTVYYRETEDGKFIPLLTTTFKETFQPLFFTFDNKDLYALSNLERDKIAVVKYNVSQSKESEVLYENKDYDVSGLNYSKARKVLTDIDVITWKNEKVFLDKETENIFNKLKKQLPNYEVYLTSANKKEDLFTIRTMNDRSLGSFYLYDKNSDKLTKLADRNPWLKEDDLAEMKPITYTSRDGLTIHGYLTLPKGKDGKNLPVVVNPHGGPWARDEWRFNPEVQFLANRGYAVLQVNYRGSTGYGKKFWMASFKQWGKKMQDDISDGVKYLISQGIADPKAIAIYGGSYGGYATLAGLAFSPELYACGVDYVGVSNLFTFMKTIPAYWKPYLAMLHEMVGDPVKDSLSLASSSPVFYADKIKAPLFVAQGAKDPRVNINESNQMVEALKKRGIDVQYMVKENEGHGFHNEENRFDFYEAMEKFLAKHLAGKNEIETAKP